MSQLIDGSIATGYELTIAKTLEEVEALRLEWEALQGRQSYPVPNADIDRYISVVEPQRDRVEPCVMHLRLNGESVAILVGRLERHTIKCRIGYKALLSPSLRCLTVVYGGILGEPADEVYRILIESLSRILRGGQADMVWFNQLRMDSAMYRIAREMTGFFSRSHFAKAEPHWVTLLGPRGQESGAQGASQRKRYVKRYTKKLEKQCGGPVRVACYRDESDVDQYVRVSAAIAESTYKAGMGVGFADTALNRSIMLQAARKGQWRGYILYAGERACAFEYGIQYHSVYFPDNIGYDPELRACSPGTVLFIKVLEDLAENARVTTFDFGFGAGVYKDRFGTESWPEASLYIFAPRPRPILINLFDSSIRGMSLALARLAHKAGWAARVKTWWREFLRKSKDKSNKSPSGDGNPADKKGSK
ncbi:MAG: GNAT family N-acetyltransferase [Phycisphaerales bacterium]|nr:MAG: GNAT family N-acetyltransferase [Phycisphaerales bacterium]